MIDFLWMDEKNTAPPTLIGIEAHLGLKDLLRLMFGQQKGLRFSAQQLMEAFTTNPRVIENRQQVLADLIANPPLVQRLREFYDKLGDWQETNNFAATDSNLLENVYSVDILFDFFAELDALTEDLKKLTLGSHLKSPWLKKLIEYLQRVSAELKWNEFKIHWNRLATPVDNLKYFSFGINLDRLLNSTEMKLLNIGAVPYNPKRPGIKNIWERFSVTNGYYPMALNKYQQLVDVVFMGREDELNDLDLLPDIIRELFTLGAEELQPVVRKWMKNALNLLIPLSNGLAFYLGGVELARYFGDHQMAWCFPKPAEGKGFKATALANPFLADANRRSEQIITNDLTLSPSGEIAVITGANEGGKTTFLVSVALAQLLYQLGLPVPAESAQISAVNTLALVFASKEENLHVSGRLGQELAELSAVLRRIRGSEVFFAFNEPLTGTSSRDSLTIMTNALTILKAAGTRGLLVTHLFGLADEIDRLNQLVGGSHLKSMIALVEGEEARPLYKIVEGRPQHTSYAKEAFYRRML